LDLLNLVNWFTKFSKFLAPLRGMIFHVFSECFMLWWFHVLCQRFPWLLCFWINIFLGLVFSGDLYLWFCTCENHTCDLFLTFFWFFTCDLSILMSLTLIFLPVIFFPAIFWTHVTTQISEVTLLSHKYQLFKGKQILAMYWSAFFFGGGSTKWWMCWSGWKKLPWRVGCDTVDEKILHHSGCAKGLLYRS